MDRHIRDQQYVAVYIKQSGPYHAAGISGTAASSALFCSAARQFAVIPATRTVRLFPHEHTARNAQRPVQPRAVYHPAVCLDIQAQIFTRPLKLWHIFYLVRRRIAVRRADPESAATAGSITAIAATTDVLPDPERDDARSVPRRIIAAALCNIPLRRLRQISEAPRLKIPRYVRDRMESARALSCKVQQFFRYPYMIHFRITSFHS